MKTGRKLLRRYVLVHIGCLECGESSQVLGIFASESSANDFWNGWVREWPAREERTWVNGSHHKLISPLDIAV